MYRRRQDVQHTVAGDVVEHGRFHVARSVDFMNHPIRFRTTRVLDPEQHLVVPRGIDDISPAIPVHVKGEIGKIIIVLALFLDFPYAAFFPLRRFIPEPAGEDVQLAVTIDIQDAGRFKPGIFVDGVDAKRHGIQGLYGDVLVPRLGRHTRVNLEAYATDLLNVPIQLDIVGCFEPIDEQLNPSAFTANPVVVPVSLLEHALQHRRIRPGQNPFSP